MDNDVTDELLPGPPIADQRALMSAMQAQRALAPQPIPPGQAQLSPMLGKSAAQKMQAQLAIAALLRARGDARAP